MTDGPPPRDPLIAALKAARIEQGLTQIEVARRMGRSTSQVICHWENAARSPSLISLNEWAYALGCELALHGAPE